MNMNLHEINCCITSSRPGVPFTNMDWFDPDMDKETQAK